MFIKSIQIRNFKTLESVGMGLSIPNGEEGSGLNIFVGENNSGKSAMFEALYFLRNRGEISVKRNSATDDSEYYVSAEFQGNISSVIDTYAQENKREPFKSFIISEGDMESLIMRRSFGNSDILKKIEFSKDGEIFRNVAGIDASVQAVFQISNIWADTSPEVESKFGASTICGNLLSDIVDKLESQYAKEYEEYTKAYNALFNSPTSGLQKELNIIARETEEILEKQFGKAKLKFKFDPPLPKDLFKKVNILVNDGEETDINQKGHGMQRAVILSLLQVYANRLIINDTKDEHKPHFLFIDEPEMGLHPQAQLRLFEALKIISRHNQIFINTHSENFISVDYIKNTQKYNKDNNNISTIGGDGFDVDLKENRKFFLHHNKLFFTQKAIFVEGAADYERFRAYLNSIGKKDFANQIYLLAGVGDYKAFYDFCNYFQINAHFIFDVDVLSKSNKALKSLDSDLWKNIQTLDKKASRKDPSSLFDSNLSEQEILLKDNLMEELKSKKMYILSEGAIEQYIDKNYQFVSEKSKEEIESIFELIRDRWIK